MPNTDEQVAMMEELRAHKRKFSVPFPGREGVAITKIGRQYYIQARKSTVRSERALREGDVSAGTDSGQH